MKLIRVLARVIGSFGGLYVAAIIIFSLPEVGKDFSFEGLMVFCIGLMMVLLEILAWFKEKIAGILLLIASIGMVLFIMLTAGHNILLAALLIPSPFYLSGFLYYVHGKESKI